LVLRCHVERHIIKSMIEDLLHYGATAAGRFMLAMISSGTNG
jgi:hypothetical protein